MSARMGGILSSAVVRSTPVPSAAPRILPTLPISHEDVHVRRRVVGQAGLGVEAAGADIDHPQGPRRERAEVALEAGLGQQDVCDDEAQGQRGQEQHRQGRDGRRRPGPSVPTLRDSDRVDPPRASSTADRPPRTSDEVEGSIATAPAGPSAADRSDRGPGSDLRQRLGRLDPRWLMAGFAVLGIAVYVLSNPARQNIYDHFVWQADAFLQGRAWIPWPLTDGRVPERLLPGRLPHRSRAAPWCPSRPCRPSCCCRSWPPSGWPRTPRSWRPCSAGSTWASPSAWSGA